MAANANQANRSKAAVKTGFRFELYFFVLPEPRRFRAGPHWSDDNFLLISVFTEQKSTEIKVKYRN